MSFEGHYQCWCKNGREGKYAYIGGRLDPDDINCPYCGERYQITNLVDDTNVDAWGKIYNLETILEIMYEETDIPVGHTCRAVCCNGHVREYERFKEGHPIGYKICGHQYEHGSCGAPLSRIIDDGEDVSTIKEYGPHTEPPKLKLYVYAVECEIRENNYDHVVIAESLEGVPGLLKEHYRNKFSWCLDRNEMKIKIHLLGIAMMMEKERVVH